MVKIEPLALPEAQCTGSARLDRFEAMLAAANGQIAAHGIVVGLVLRALTAVDRHSGAAIAMALEVAEMDLVDFQGETETVRALRHVREQLAHALPPDRD